MKHAAGLMCCALALGCSAAADAPGSGGVPAGGAGQAATSAGASGTGVSGGASGVPSSAGQSGAGLPATSGAASNAAAGAGGASTAGSGGESGGAATCTPNPAGALVSAGDTVHDQKTCLDWMKATKTGVNYAAAETFCTDSLLGGFDDWRIPSASELASTVTLCGKYPPEGPIDTMVFDQQGDGYWTSTPAGEPNKVCAVGMLNAGDYYHYGTAGPQVVRCVRGSGAFKTVKDCTAASGCKTW